MIFDKTIKVGRSIIGDGHPCFIIAEAGSNHGRSLKKAKLLIDIAAGAGADAVKFQSFSASRLMIPTDPDFKLVSSVELPVKFLEPLKSYADKRKIIFCSTPFDFESADLLDKLGMPFFKIASGDITYKELLQYIAAKQKPIFLSTGKCGLSEINLALKWIREKKNRKLALLHCLSKYPALPSEMNLKVINSLKDIYRLPIGLSDHTEEFYLPSIAVALGAAIIEKHFTYSKKAKGPDHSYALEPKELELMIKAIKDAEASFGSLKKSPTLRERKNLGSGRRSLYAAVNINKGTTLNAGHLLIVRPQSGIPANLKDNYIGRRVKRDIKKYSPLNENDFI